MKVFAEKDHRRIVLQFKAATSAEYSRCVDGVRSIPGRSYRRGSGAWTVPLDLEALRSLRTTYGGALRLRPRLRAWAAEQVAEEEELTELSAATTGRLEMLPLLLPQLAEAIHLGPIGLTMTKKQRKKALKGPGSYQVADVQFLVRSRSPLNTNQMGTGKTLELIASIFEGGMHEGAHLIVTPKTSIETVWVDELKKWQPMPVLAAIGSRANREAVLKRAWKWSLKGKAFWLVVNPEMVQYRKDPEHLATDFIKQAHEKQDGTWEAGACECNVKVKPHWHYYSPFREIHRIPFKTMTIDECHVSAVCNTKSITHQALKDVHTEKRILQSGTPMGGKPLRLFGLLQFLRPDVFTSKWTWARQWLVIDQSDYGQRITNKFRDDVEEAFARSMAPYLLRRTKAEVLPWLPPKQYVNVWCDMTPAQEKQYRTFAEDAEVTIKKNRLIGKAVLDEYTRLRQFAIAKQTIRKKDGKLVPTRASGKLAAIEQDLIELGIAGNKTDRWGDEQVIIFSQFTEVVDMMVDWLQDMDIDCAKITGKIKDKERTRLQRQFQDGNLRVLVMNVKAGGVSITLDRANTVMFVDQTFNPDDQEQAEDRAHRASRIHQVTVRYYRSKGTIEEQVFDDVTQKELTNDQVLDRRRLASR